jgi:antitoxin component YwqK of YwqJK toxin-antitoxin module
MEFWKNGLLEGPSITFSENASNGLFTSKISYKAGKRHGKCQWFYEKSVLPGQLRCEANYENGEQHGLTTWWYDNGQILSKEKFVNGKFHGVKKAWYSNGKIATIEKWKDGKQVFDKNWDKDGNKLNQDFPITPPIGILKD